MPTDNELMKMHSGGQITNAEYKRLMKMPHKERYGKSGMKKPESGGKPKRITTKGKPGDTGPGGAHPARDRIPEHKTVMKPTPAKMRAEAAGLRRKNPHRGAKKTPTGSSSVGGY